MVIWTLRRSVDPLIADTGVAKVGTSPGAEATTKLNELVVAVALLRSVTVTVSGKVPA